MTRNVLTFLKVFVYLYQLCCVCVLWEDVKIFFRTVTQDPVALFGSLPLSAAPKGVTHQHVVYDKKVGGTRSGTPGHGVSSDGAAGSVYRVQVG